MAYCVVAPVVYLLNKLSGFYALLWQYILVFVYVQLYDNKVMV